MPGSASEPVVLQLTNHAGPKSSDIGFRDVITGPGSSYRVGGSGVRQASRFAYRPPCGEGLHSTPRLRPNRQVSNGSTVTPELPNGPLTTVTVVSTPLPPKIAVSRNQT